MNRKDLLEKLKAPNKRNCIAIPEFGDDAKAYFSALTPRDEIEIQNMLVDIELKPTERGVYQGMALLVQKLETKEGEKLLQPGDFSLLLNVKSSVVSRIANEINLGIGNFDELVEEEKKPSKPTESD